MNSPSPRSGAPFANGTQMFIRTLALAHACAFGSLWIQSAGLIGPRGVLPAGQFFSMAYEQLGRSAWFEAPSLCWVFGAGPFIGVLCFAGLVASALLFFGVAPAVSLLVLWVSYLSLSSAGQVFMDFQWDALLLECTLIAVFLVPWTFGRRRTPYDPPRLARYLAWWLLFRLMFLSGLVKLGSGDATWRHLTALTHHYQTQPLPTPLAWYANLLTVWFQVASCALMFAVELLAPLCIPAPRKVRHIAALSMIALQLLIALTGNYAFFNLLTIGLCFTCLDDDWWRSLHWGLETPEGGAGDFARNHGKVRGTLVRWFAAFTVGITFFETVAAIYRPAAASPLVRFVANAVGPVRSFNDYGLFAVMTVERPELVFEGSDDGVDWKEYSLPFKPGELSRRPRWVAPYQPRLDWQLWFAALGPPDNSPWVGTVCEKLLRGEPEVLALFARNPFPEHPPRDVRVVRYRYEFTGGSDRARTGNWWRRTPIDFFVPPVTLPR